MRRKWHFYNNGVEETSFFEGEEIPEGYVQGRLPFKESTRTKISRKATGRSSPLKGIPLKDEVREKMSESKQRFLKEHPDWVSPTSFKKGQVAWNKGVPCKEETKKKLSEAHTGKHYSKEINKKKGRPGRQVSEKSRLKMSKAKKAWYMSHPEERQRISERLTGRTVTKETRQKLSQVVKHFKGPSSKEEEKVYGVLISLFGLKAIQRQYKSERYPWHCDFYIEPLDLFIECNFHWTHGPHPFDSTSPEDLEKLRTLEEKAQNSDYYKDAISVWTSRDVAKLNCFKDKKLNYLIFYSFKSFKKFIHFCNKMENLDDFKRRIQEEDFQRQVFS